MVWYENIKISFIFINLKSLGNNQCTNIYCRSSSLFKYDDNNFLEDRNKVAAEAIQLLTECAQLCVNDNLVKNYEEKSQIKNLTENNLQQLINQCKQINNWNLLKQSIELIFSNRLYLSTSFLKKDYLENLSINQQTTTTTSATPKS